MAFRKLFLRTAFSIGVFMTAGLAFLHFRKMIGYTSGEAMVQIIKESRSPKTFSIVGTFVIILNSLYVLLFGRNGGPKAIREYLVLRPAEYSLGLVAAFTGLLLAYAIYYKVFLLGVGGALAALLQGGAIIWFITISDTPLLKGSNTGIRLLSGLIAIVATYYFYLECAV